MPRSLEHGFEHQPSTNLLQWYIDIIYDIRGLINSEKIISQTWFSKPYMTLSDRCLRKTLECQQDIQHQQQTVG